MRTGYPNSEGLYLQEPLKFHPSTNYPFTYFDLLLISDCLEFLVYKKVRKNSHKSHEDCGKAQSITLKLRPMNSNNILFGPSHCTNTQQQVFQ